MSVAPCQVEIYSDGGADPNPGPGGWGAVLVSEGKVKEISGAQPSTTNNRMELTAAIEALTLLKRPCRVSFYTDSLYLRRGITEWAEGWQRSGWVRANGAPVENEDLWRRLLDARAIHSIQWHWVRGHSGHRYNERADRLATEARRAPGRQGKRIAPTSQPAPDTGLAEYEVYARGCALTSPGPGGYAAVLDGPLGESVQSGAWPVATNNVMDLWAVIAALRSLPGPSRVTVHTPSKYVIDGAMHWLAGWERNGWRTQGGQPVKNREVWQELSQVMGDHDVRWHHLPVDNDEPRAERAAALAREQAQRQAAGPAAD